MRALVVLAVLGMCSAVPFIRDTPEVAAEKVRFFEVFRAAEAAAQPQPKAVVSQPKAVVTQQASTSLLVQPKWTGPVAATIPAGVPGSSPQVPDTLEVAAARSEFFNTYQAQLAATASVAETPVQPQPAPVAETPVQPQPAPTFSPAPVPVPVPVRPKWTGPVAATIPAGVPGFSPQVPDTPEVMAAKQTFFNTYQQQVAAVAPTN